MAKLKVGDKVKVVTDSSYYAREYYGSTGVVVSTDELLCSYELEFNGRYNCAFSEKELELVESVLKKGNRVRVESNRYGLASRNKNTGTVSSVTDMWAWVKLDGIHDLWQYYFEEITPLDEKKIAGLDSIKLELINLDKKIDETTRILNEHRETLKALAYAEKVLNGDVS